MKETPISNIEKNFILECIRKNLRLDGRKFNEFRSLKINFGSEYGTAHVTLGDTRVLAHVTCELGEPKSSRPNEGLLHINVELSQMAAINFDSGRNNDITVKINRILEKTFKDSRCVDLESLCITSEDRVWVLKVNISVLNYEGNIVDCASIAALCALAHFRHPDVTVSDNEIKIHSLSEKDPIPITLHHYPVCISFATFQNGEKAIVDPTILEEKTAEANMVFGFNSYREVCCINLGGTTLTSTELFLQCAHQASNRARDVVNKIKAALELDEEARSAGKSVGFAQCLQDGKITSLAENRLTLKLPDFNLNDAKIKQEPMKIDDNIKKENKIEDMNSLSILNSAQLNIKWVPDSASSTTDNSDLEDEEPTLDQQLEEASQRENIGVYQSIAIKKTQVQKSRETSDSEEETTMVLF